jgi:hypothetical protein
MQCVHSVGMWRKQLFSYCPRAIGVMELCDSHAQWRIHKFLPVGLKNNAYILTKEMCYEF